MSSLCLLYDSKGQGDKGQGDKGGNKGQGDKGSQAFNMAALAQDIGARAVHIQQNVQQTQQMQVLQQQQLLQLQTQVSDIQVSLQQIKDNLAATSRASSSSSVVPYGPSQAAPSGIGHFGPSQAAPSGIGHFGPSQAAPSGIGHFGSSQAASSAIVSFGSARGASSEPPGLQTRQIASQPLLAPIPCWWMVQQPDADLDFKCKYAGKHCDPGSLPVYWVHFSNKNRRGGAHALLCAECGRSNQNEIDGLVYV